MSASLVGSEMCIRDRYGGLERRARPRQQEHRTRGTGRRKVSQSRRRRPPMPLHAARGAGGMATPPRLPGAAAQARAARQ
eukprot:1898523-Alexandrium_andersonii.AAC.1